MELKLELVNAILHYLSRQPYADVAELIKAIQEEYSKTQPKKEEK